MVIDDYIINLINKNIKLGNKYQGQYIYEVFYWLRNKMDLGLEVFLRLEKAKDNSGGYYSRNTNTIVINNQTFKDGFVRVLDVLVHELTHAQQFHDRGDYRKKSVLKKIEYAMHQYSQSIEFEFKPKEQEEYKYFRIFFHNMINRAYAGNITEVDARLNEVKIVCELLEAVCDKYSTKHNLLALAHAYRKSSLEKVIVNNNIYSTYKELFNIVPKEDYVNLFKKGVVLRLAELKLEASRKINIATVKEYASLANNYHEDLKEDIGWLFDAGPWLQNGSMFTLPFGDDKERVYKKRYVKKIENALQNSEKYNKALDIGYKRYCETRLENKDMYYKLLKRREDALVRDTFKEIEKGNIFKGSDAKIDIEKDLLRLLPGNYKPQNPDLIKALHHYGSQGIVAAQKITGKLYTKETVDKLLATKEVVGVARYWQEVLVGLDNNTFKYALAEIKEKTSVVNACYLKASVLAERQTLIEKHQKVTTSQNLKTHDENVMVEPRELINNIEQQK